ncbi:Bro2 [Heliothis virescens ascovirus 3j]|uniref:Bro2 n=1 Tax=Heliothis virescens ascovirus 3j TaxID=1561067 RepID=A0A2Z5UZB1_9VIRU|nr:Bro2 [Heliothis virescens ascovirus 3j]
MGRKVLFTTLKVGNRRFRMFTLVHDDGCKWYMARSLSRAWPRVDIDDAVSKFVSRKNQLIVDELPHQAICMCTVTMFLQKNILFINAMGICELLLQSRAGFTREFKYWLCNVHLSIQGGGLFREFDKWRQAAAGKATIHQPKSDRTRGIVYVVTNKVYERLLLYRVGATVDMRRRISILDSGSPYGYEFAMSYATSNYALLLRVLKAKLAHRHVRNDFYKLSEIDIDNVRVLCVNGEHW